MMKSSQLKSVLAFLVISILFSSVSIADETKKASLVVHTDKGTHQISRNIYGHFAKHLGNCIYQGVWVGSHSSIPNTRGIRNDVVKALREIKVPVVRWPGGCFADTYHWKDGIGPQEKRKGIMNEWSCRHHAMPGTNPKFLCQQNTLHDAPYNDAKLKDGKLTMALPSKSVIALEIE